jgi:hypothetical protein
MFDVFCSTTMNSFLFYLTFMEPCIVGCVFYITNEMQLIQCSLLLTKLYMSTPTTQAEQFQPIHTSGRQQESMTIPKAAHFYELLMMGRKTAHNM